VRWNASKAFLRPVIDRPNLEVLGHAQVTRICLSEDGSRRVLGVQVRMSDASRATRIFDLRPRGELLMAAGAVHTPAVLQVSGIGPSEVLKSAGVQPQIDLPGVGANRPGPSAASDGLQGPGVSAPSTNRPTAPGARPGWDCRYLFARRGPMTMSPSQLGAFASSTGDSGRPDLEYHVQPLSLDKFGDPLHRFPAFTASVCNLRPSSRGTVRISSADPLAAPMIQPNYLSTEQDRRIAVEAIRLTRRIVSAPALSRYRPEEFLPGGAVASDEALAQAAGDIGTTIFHPVGTCRMGHASDPMAVVDARLRVHGISGLRIVDASVMPTITSGNTNAPTLMIAERAAEMIREDAR
jgi:choline dehydrogenase